MSKVLNKICNEDCFNCPYDDCIHEDNFGGYDESIETDRQILKERGQSTRFIKYNTSEKGKARRKAFNASPKGKACMKRYNNSEKGKARYKRYSESEKGKETKRKYRQTERYKQYRREYQRKRYAKLKEERIKQLCQDQVTN